MSNPGKILKTVTFQLNMYSVTSEALNFKINPGWKEMQAQRGILPCDFTPKHCSLRK